MKILSVEPSSPLFSYIRPGYKLLSINGAAVDDVIDYQFKASTEKLNIRFSDPAGKELDFDFEGYYPAELGLTFDDRRIRTCKNDCIFCFVHQQPQGMRRALYIEDEDFRLSFTHGNFVTLSNTTDADIARIIEQRLSPLYVSVHATDDTLRRCMLRNEKLHPIIPRLKQLTDNGIVVHTQVVLCPDINDGEQLERTINELAALYPGIETLAVVPVGLTKFRGNLPNLKGYNKEQAQVVLRQISKKQKENLKKLGTRFVWGSDEFYVAAGQKLPRKSFYEEMQQFENGIGMMREFIYMFNKRRSRFKNLKSKKRVLFLTGNSAYPYFSSEIMPYINNELGLNVQLHMVKNRFWGESVTVSGLLTGQDLLRTARMKKDEFDTLVLPPNCLNNDNLFLDNLSFSQFETALGKPVLIGQYNLAETLKEIYQNDSSNSCNYRTPKRGQVLAI